MSKDNSSSIDPFDVGQITERLPAWELWEEEDGIEPADETVAQKPAKVRERAA
jgi:hypothetical protein